MKQKDQQTRGHTTLYSKHSSSYDEEDVASSQIAKLNRLGGEGGELSLVKVTLVPASLSLF